MKTPNQIVKELKHVVEWSQPNIRYNEIMSLIKQLEISLNPPTNKPTPIIEKPVVKAPVVETPVEELTIEEISAEVLSADVDTVEETPTTIKTTRKK
jgi:hypothetical protein